MTMVSCVLDANYMARRLRGHYPIVFTNDNGKLCFECELHGPATEGTLPDRIHE